MARNVRKTFVAKAIYGLVTVLAVLLVMEDHPPAAWRGAVTVFGATLAVALVEMYAETIAAMLDRQRRPTGAEIRETLFHVACIVAGALAPTIVLLLSAMGFWSVDQAIDIAKAVLFLFLFGYGARVGQLLHEQWHRQVLSGLILVAIAGLIVALKALPLFH